MSEQDPVTSSQQPRSTLTGGLFAAVHDEQPFISDVDVIDEKITIVNPCAVDLDLTGYHISDFHGKHVYHFPVGYMLPAESKAVLFCCPGTRPNVDDYQVNHLLWRNRDGTMRRKEVLNNGGDSAILLNSAGVQIAMCTHLGEMKLLGKSSKVAPSPSLAGEHTGAIPLWRLLVLPLLLLFLMSYFFEAPHESFHTKLERVVERLQDAENELAVAHSNSVHAKERYVQLHSAFLDAQAELALLKTSEADIDVASDSGLLFEALFREFREERNAEFDNIRAEIQTLHDQLSPQQQESKGEDTADPSVLLETRVQQLSVEVDQLQDEAVGMVRDFESMAEAVDRVQEAQRQGSDRLERAVARLEAELTEDMADYARSGGPDEQTWRAQAMDVVTDMLKAGWAQEMIAARVQEKRGSRSGAPPMEVPSDVLERMVAAALEAELRQYRAEAGEELQRGIASILTESKPEQCAPSAGEEIPVRPDFAMRGAGGRVVYDCTSATYLPSVEDEDRLSGYHGSPPSTRSSVSGLLTGALGRVETLLGSSAPPRASTAGLLLARKGFFESSVGGPDEALSQDVSLGSCWAMQGSRGELTVRLRAPLRVSGVTLDHVSRQEATDISTAPARFAVLGYSEIQGQTDPRLLLEGVYDIDSELKSQTFLMSEGNSEAYEFIKLEIFSNHGHANYTCLYRFRVHGEV